MSNRFTGNVFLPVCRIGIKLVAGSGGNVIAMNDFHGMWCESDSYNLWNDADGNGNYWSRYNTGVDQDGDGIADSPYAIFGEAQEFDVYPAMSQHFLDAEVEWDRCGFKEP